MRKSTTAIALALLWAPAAHAFPQQSITRGAMTTSNSPFPTVLAAAAATESSDFNDWEALDRKNLSRKKFGLKPMTVAQFVENEVAVSQMAVEQHAKQQQQALEDCQRQAQQQQQQQSQQQPFVPGFIEKMMEQVLPDQCESNFDCERPKICCDFGAAKVCCAGGSKQRAGGVQGQLELIPVPLGRPQGPAHY